MRIHNIITLVCALAESDRGDNCSVLVNSQGHLRPYSVRVQYSPGSSSCQNVGQPLVLFCC